MEVLDAIFAATELVVARGMMTPIFVPMLRFRVHPIEPLGAQMGMRWKEHLTTLCTSREFDLQLVLVDLILIRNSSRCTIALRSLLKPRDECGNRILVRKRAG